MRRAVGLALGAALLACTVPSLATEAAPAIRGEVGLSYQIYRNWEIQLPDAQRVPIGDRIPVGVSGGSAALEGSVLRLDSDGDGELDVAFVPPKPDEKEQSRLAKLVGKDAAGNPVTRAVRLLYLGAWVYLPGGALVCEVQGTQVKLVDQNGDGRFDELGVDAMIVGHTKHATFLSRVVNIDGELFEIHVAKDSSRMSFRPYKGSHGTLDLVSGFESSGRLIAAIVTSADGQLSFDLGQRQAGLRVPVGEYVLHSGVVAKGQAVAKIRTGRSKTVDVTAGNTVSPKWGGPLQAEFQYQHAGAQVAFSPKAVWHYGKAGVEFFDFQPPGRSPEFIIRDASTDRELKIAKFVPC